MDSLAPLDQDAESRGMLRLGTTPAKLLLAEIGVILKLTVFELQVHSFAIPWFAEYIP